MAVGDAVMMFSVERRVAARKTPWASWPGRSVRPPPACPARRRRCRCRAYPREEFSLADGNETSVASDELVRLPVGSKLRRPAASLVAPTFDCMPTRHAVVQHRSLGPPSWDAAGDAACCPGRAGPVRRLRRRPRCRRPGEFLPVDRARHRHRLRTSGHAGGGRTDLPRPALPRCFSGGDAAWGRTERTSSRRSPTAMRRRSSIDKFCNGEDVRKRPPPMVHLMSQKMGITSGASTTRCRTTSGSKVPLRRRQRAP